MKENRIEVVENRKINQKKKKKKKRNINFDKFLRFLFVVLMFCLRLFPKKETHLNGIYIFGFVWFLYVKWFFVSPNFHALLDC